MRMIVVKPHLIPIIIISVLVSGLLLGCDSEPKSTQTPTNSELQTQVETLQEELKQLREQEKAETIQKAEAYYAIVEFYVGGSSASSSTEKPTAGISEPTSIQPLTVEAIVSSLTTSSKAWGLIKATEDPYLISTCQPNEWGQMPVSYSYIKNYAEGKYRELMSEYYSQQYIDNRLYILEQARQESADQAAKEEAERMAAINNLPFTYTGKGSGRTPSFWTPSGSSNYQYKLTLTTAWDGDISINWYQEDTSGTKSSLITMQASQVWQSTGISFGFPDSVEAGKIYEYIFNWNKSNQVVFFDITNVPTDGEWTLTVSQMDVVTPRPKVGITLVVEYEGRWSYQQKGSFVWYGRSGNETKVFESIGLPWHYWAQISDEGTSPLVVKILYNDEAVAQDTAIGKDDVAYVFWEGPQ